MDTMLDQTNELVMIVGTADGCCGTVAVTQIGNGQAARLADMLKALAHPVRLQMVDILSRQGGEVCVCDIEMQFNLKQPTISHHLKILRQAGLIDCERRGLWAYYYTVPENLAELSRLVGALAESND